MLWLSKLGKGTFELRPFEKGHAQCDAVLMFPRGYNGQHILLVSVFVCSASANALYLPCRRLCMAWTSA